MGGRNGGAMGKSGLNHKKQEKKHKVVTMPRRNGGKNAEAGGDGDEKAAAETPEKSKEKATEEDEKEESKGAKKALRHAVKKVVKKNSGPIADALVKETENGDMRSAAMVLSLIEKKKKKDGDDDDWDGPSLSEILVPDQLWREKAAAKQMENDEEEETKAA
jgi:hypothetical protein